MRRLVGYFMAATTLTAITLALAFAMMAYGQLRRVADLQDALLESRQLNNACSSGLDRADAKLEMVQTLFDTGRANRLAAGGP